MAEIVGVRFKNAGKVYYFSPGGFALEKGGTVVVETSRGIECGEVVIPNRQIAGRRGARIAQTGAPSRDRG